MNLTLFGSAPSASIAALTVTSPTPRSALSAIVLPSRSLGSRMSESLADMMICHSFSGDSAPLSALAIALIGRPLALPTITGTQPRNANWSSPETRAVTSSLPPCASAGSISMPSSLKKPWSRAMYSGAALAIGSTPTLTLVTPPSPPPDDASSSPPHPATSAAHSSATIPRCPRTLSSLPRTDRAHDALSSDD